MIVDLNLKGKHVIVIGGGVEGVRKVKGLLGQGCKITVISSRLNRFLVDCSKRNDVEIIKSEIKNADILSKYRDASVVLAATNDRLLNRQLIKKGRDLGAFVYAADDPTVSDFSYASVINIEGVMQVAISTSGKSPIVARQVRIRAERVLRKIIRKTDIDNARLQEFARLVAREKIRTVVGRKQFLYSLINDKSIQNLIKEDKMEEAKSATLVLLQSWSENRPG